GPSLMQVMRKMPSTTRRETKWKPKWRGFEHECVSWSEKRTCSATTTVFPRSERQFPTLH
ncbi:hypothetical protein GGH20_004989, partial [Coemansia sp. RSA 1937]